MFKLKKFDLEEFTRTAERIWQRAKEDRCLRPYNNLQKQGRLSHNPSDEELRKLVEKEPRTRKTIYGNFVAESEPTSRAAIFTKNSVDDNFGEVEQELLSQCERALSQERLISIDRIVGNEDSEKTVRLIVPERFAHIALGGGNLFLSPKKEIEEPTYQIVFFADKAFEENKSKPLPQKDITIRLAMLKDCKVIKIVRNSNYIGEYKKGVFAAEDWNVKTKKGGIFLHAGCRKDILQSPHGDYRTTRSLILALSANGKTTLTSKILARKGKEKSWLIQDDGGTLMPDGSFWGFEAGGIFVKTEGVNPGEQTEIYYGLLKPDTLLENVYVDENGDFDFYNLERTSNGRAVVLRKDSMHTSPYIDAEKIDNLILITRGPTIPAIAKLTCEQTTALMIVGQAIESSAGDPTRTGQIRNEFFYDPFVAGDRTEHANRFYEILKGLPDINYYLINTGGIGEGERYHDITVRDTLGILDSLFRGGFDDPQDWVNSPTGFKIPVAIRTVDDIFVHPEKLYSRAESEEKQKNLNRTRIEAIEKIGEGLDKNIKNVFN